MDALNAQSDSQKKKAVRLDLQLQHETDELLVDCIVTHSLAKSHLKAEAKRTMDRLTSPIVEVQDRAAAAIDKARQKKTNSYVPLMYVIKKQVLDGRRRKAQKFTPAALTSFGELGPGCALIQEWLAMRLKAHHVAQGQRPDGQSPEGLTAAFRRQFRLALIMTTVRRLGAMQRGSGLPGRCVRA